MVVVVVVVVVWVVLVVVLLVVLVVSWQLQLEILGVVVDLATADAQAAQPTCSKLLLKIFAFSLIALAHQQMPLFSFRSHED